MPQAMGCGVYDQQDFVVGIHCLVHYDHRYHYDIYRVQDCQVYHFVGHNQANEICVYPNQEIVAGRHVTG